MKNPPDNLQNFFLKIYFGQRKVNEKYFVIEKKKKILDPLSSSMVNFSLI